MQLTIDLGNTKIKFVIFNAAHLIASFSVPVDEWIDTLKQIRKQYPTINNSIISDVNGSITKELVEALNPIPVLFCTSALKLPFKTSYNPSNQLGADRIALLAACTLEYPDQNALVIDLGSCITYDVIDREKMHHGGAISPGFGMRYKAMHAFSGRLPLLDSTSDPLLFGTATESAMHAGVFQGIFAEIRGVIRLYEQKFDFLTVILTGGDAERLPKPLKNSIFAHSNFLAKGLNFILASNINS